MRRPALLMSSFDNVASDEDIFVITLDAFGAAPDISLGNMFDNVLFGVAFVDAFDDVFDEIFDDVFDVFDVFDDVFDVFDDIFDDVFDNAAFDDFTFDVAFACAALDEAFEVLGNVDT